MPSLKEFYPLEVAVEIVYWSSLSCFPLENRPYFWQEYLKTETSEYDKSAAEYLLALY